MSLLCFLSALLFLKFISTTLPNCSNDQEVEKFIRSPQYSSLFSLNANVSKRDLSPEEIVRESESEVSLNVSDILPENRTAYLKRRAPPFCNRPANAVFHITLLSLDSINESDMTLVLDFWLTIAWFDTRLRYPNGSIRDVRLLDNKWFDQFWKPDAIFTNAREIKVLNQIVPNQGLKMLRDQVIVLLSKITTTITCPMSFEKYPHDVQICEMKMESMLYTKSELTFSWDVESPISIHLEHEALKTPQFKIPKAAIKTVACDDPAYPSGNYSCLRVVFRLERSLGYHMIHTYIPSGSVVLLSWITFWMKPEAIAARFGLGVTSLLTLVTLNSQSQKDLPPESYSKAIDMWMMSCALFVFGSILEFAVVNYLVCRFSENSAENIKNSQETDKVWYRIRAIFPNSRIQMICHNIDRIARVSFPLCFISLNIWYWNKYLNNRETEKP